MNLNDTLQLVAVVAILVVCVVWVIRRVRNKRGSCCDSDSSSCCDSGLRGVPAFRKVQQEVIVIRVIGVRDGIQDAMIPSCRF